MTRGHHGIGGRSDVPLWDIGRGRIALAERMMDCEMIARLNGTGRDTCPFPGNSRDIAGEAMSRTADQEERRQRRSGRRSWSACMRRFPSPEEYPEGVGGASSSSPSSFTPFFSGGSGACRRELTSSQANHTPRPRRRRVQPFGVPPLSCILPNASYRW